MGKFEKIARKFHEQIHLSFSKDQLTTLILQKLEETAKKIADKIKQ